MYFLSPAHKTLRVKFPEHGGDTAALDGLVAASTEAAPEAVVMGLAVGEALVLIKLAAPEWLPALLAHKAVRMPLKQVILLTDGHYHWRCSPVDSGRRCNCL